MLRICLLGGIALEHDGAPIAPPAGRPARALLGWLALHPGPHARADLAARLWPDVLDSSARASLRSAAWALRGSLGPAADLLEADRGALGLRADAVWVDALEPDPGAGELLPGLDDEWVLLARDDHHDRVAAALAAQVDAADDPATALAAARRLAAHDPLGEEAHRRLMQAQADAGDVAAALTTHARLTDRLRRELGVAPSTATRELANDLRAPADRTLRFRGSDPGISTFGEQAAGFGGAAAARPALVGRETELAALRDAWVRAADGAGRLVLIEGEPGIGKTRLAAEVLAEARAVGARVARAAPPEVGGAPLDLWTELLRDLCEDVEPPPAGTPWVDDLATLVPSVGLCLGARGVREPARFGDPELVRARLLDAIAEAVAWAAADRPVALLLDDLHLADAGSVAALARVGRRLPRLALLVLATRRELPRRPEIDAVAHALAAREAADEPISLVPLPADAVAELARGAGLRAAAEIDQVVAAADGNPLLATASARAMVRGEQEPPRTLRGAVRADAARLAPEPLRLAELLAIAGRELTATELDALGLEDRPAAVAAGVDAGLLRAPQGRAGYRHALLRDAMVHDLPSARRAALHEQLADALQHADAADPAPARAAEMGRHLQAAGRNTEAAERLRQAGERARSLGAMPEALEFLAEAVALDPARPDLRLDHAALLAWLGREDAAVGEFGRALDAMPPADAVGRAEAWVVRGDWYRSSLCVPHLALRAFREARTELHAAPDAPIEVRVHALAGAAWAEALSGDLDEVDRLLDEICSIAGPLAERDEVVHELGHARSTALIRRGRFVESYAPALEAADAALRVGRLDMAYGALGNAACAAACAGDLPRALAFTERIELASRDVAPPIHAEVLATRAILLARMGRHDEARAEIAREREVVSGLEDPVASATAAFDEGVVALAAGEDEAAAELFDHALRGHAKCSRAAARLSRAEALARLDRLDEAEQELRATALEPMSPSDQPDTLVPRLTRLQGLVAEHRGDHDLAVRRLREAVDGWRRVAADRDGERYTALLADVGRLPLGGLVMPARELERVEQELHALEPAVNT